jgi:predicted secreted acid phosphatase
LFSFPTALLSKRTLPLIICSLTLGACASTTGAMQAETKAETNAENYSLSTAVVYQTESKEYPLLSSYVYAQATKALPASLQPSDVIVMDVDETVLDNSQYQREREQQGLGYSSESWNAWIARKEATAVARGGKVALVTNRDKSMDDATWQNLLALGLPLTAENTCILGRTAQDKTAIDGNTVINDKDLRRSQLKQGTVNCSNSTTTSKPTWQAQHRLLMQIGDNIEDFEGVTQEHANVDALLPKVGKSLFILPNPMYGSW